MGDPRRIFISHNSAHNAESRLFLDELVEALRIEKDEAGKHIFEVLVDRDLTAGEPWRGPLYTWMLLCHAAVLLIDKSTPDTTWVPREAMIFSWRRELDAKFDLYAVLRGVGKDILTKPPFKEMGLENRNFVAGDGTGAIVAALKRNVASSSDRRLKKLELLLQIPEAAAFEEAQEMLALGEEWDFLRTFQPHRSVAATLLGLGFRRGPFPPNKLDHPSARVLNSLSPLLPEGRKRKIAELMASYFVAREVGAELYRAIRQTQVIALRLNLRETTHWPHRFVAAHFAEAFSQDIAYQPTVLPLSPLLPGNGMDDPLTSIRSAIYSSLWPLISEGKNVWSKEDEPKFREFCENASGRPDFFLWALESDAIKIDEMVKIQKDMPYLRLIYLWSKDCPEHTEAYCLGTNLECQTEKIAFTETQKAHNILKLEQINGLHQAV